MALVWTFFLDHRTVPSFSLKHLFIVFHFTARSHHNSVVLPLHLFNLFSLFYHKKIGAVLFFLVKKCPSTSCMLGADSKEPVADAYRLLWRH